MTELGKANEFIDQLIYRESKLAPVATILNSNVPVEFANFLTVGAGNNFEIKKLEPTYLEKNPYFNNIQIKDCRVGNIYLNKKDFYIANLTYSFDSLKRDPITLAPIYKYCYFTDDVHYPSLGTIFPTDKWMGVEPSEINTFSSFIKKAKGKILLMGCGLGYVAYMLSLKKDVEEITIVELDPGVIQMFLRYLKPQMNSKINIVQADVMEFLEKEDISMYQYCSVDIWHGIKDMFPIYLKCLLLEQKHPKTKFHYWLEEDLHVCLESTWLTILKDVINQKNPNEKSDVFTEILKMQNIETVDDVRSFMLAPKRPIMIDWAINNPEDAYNHESLDETLKKLYRR